MDNIILFVECFLKHKSIVLQLNKTEMMDDITQFGTLSINDLMGHNYLYELTAKMMNHYDNYFIQLYGKSVVDITDDVHERFTGNDCHAGHGHLIRSKTWKFPEGWCVKVEKYQQIQLKEHEWLALRICGIDLTIASISGYTIKT